MLRVELAGARSLRFDDGSPVRAASGLARLGDGWLVAQDDATHAAWVRAGSVTPVRVLPPVEGHDAFSAATATKLLKPDLEAACEVDVGGEPAVLLLGSGSSARRRRAALVRLRDGEPQAVAADLGPLYDRVAAALGAELNLEGACLAGDRLRWFNRGNGRPGTLSGSVDVDLGGLVAAVLGSGPVEAVAVTRPAVHDLGAVRGVGLAVTDAVALPGGKVLLAAAAEDTPNAIDDGEVVASALVLVQDDPSGRSAVTGVAPLPEGADGTVWKVEGLGLQAADEHGATLLAVVDADDPSLPSAALTLRVRWVSAAR